MYQHWAAENVGGLLGPQNSSSSPRTCSSGYRTSCLARRGWMRNKLSSHTRDRAISPRSSFSMSLGVFSIQHGFHRNTDDVRSRKIGTYTRIVLSHGPVFNFVPQSTSCGSLGLARSAETIVERYSMSYMVKIIIIARLPLFCGTLDSCY